MTSSRPDTSHDPLLLNWEKVTGDTVIPLNKDGQRFHFLSHEPLPYRIYDACIWRKGGAYYSLSGSVDYNGPGGKTNWELSADRANAGRSLLQAGGLSSDRIYEVSGKAGSEPLLPEDPNGSANRRLSITLLREAPPAPPGHQL